MNCPAMPPGGGRGMKFRKPLRPKTRKITPARYRAIVEAVLITGFSLDRQPFYGVTDIEDTGLGLSDFAVLEVLLHKGPLPVNTIGPIVDLTPGSISIAVDRLFAKGLVNRIESTEDRQVRIVGLTQRGKDLIVPAFRKHSGQMRRVL